VSIAFKSIFLRNFGAKRLQMVHTTKIVPDCSDNAYTHTKTNTFTRDMQRSVSTNDKTAQWLTAHKTHSSNPHLANKCMSMHADRITIMDLLISVQNCVVRRHRPAGET
jgi:hypothetical protein